MRDNISKTILDEDPSYVASNISSAESFMQPANQAINSLAKTPDSSTNAFNGLDISTLLNISDGGDDTETLNEGYTKSLFFIIASSNSAYTYNEIDIRINWRYREEKSVQQRTTSKYNNLIYLNEYKR